MKSQDPACRDAFLNGFLKRAVPAPARDGRADPLSERSSSKERTSTRRAAPSSAACAWCSRWPCSPRTSSIAPSCTTRRWTARVEAAHAATSCASRLSFTLWSVGAGRGPVRQGRRPGPAAERRCRDSRPRCARMLDDPQGGAHLRGLSCPVAGARQAALRQGSDHVSQLRPRRLSERRPAPRRWPS